MILFVLNEYEIFRILTFQIILNLDILSIWADLKIWTKVGSREISRKFAKISFFDLNKVNIAQTNIGYIPPLPKSIMALNISFNPIYDFDKGFDFKTFGFTTFKIYES